MKHLRKLLFPFSAIYYVIVGLRNFLFDTGLFKSKEYDFPVICVGNLSTGGTGKTPMTELLIRLLKDRISLAVLSRGYGRSTSGYICVKKSHTAIEVGDEPLQYRSKFENVTVAVCENRKVGIERLMKENYKPTTILLDDAFQHRKVKAGFYILLTSYGDIFYDDYLLPSGNLRESRSGARRSQTIIVTKCPEGISEKEQMKIKSKLSKYTDNKIYFASVTYSNEIYNNKEKIGLSSLTNKSITLVTGIANPEPLLDFLMHRNINYNHKKYRDHHNFTDSEIEMLEDSSFILTTEKDYMRLKSRVRNSKLYYLPIETRFVGGDKEVFEKEILGFSGLN